MFLLLTLYLQHSSFIIKKQKLQEFVWAFEPSSDILEILHLDTLHHIGIIIETSLGSFQVVEIQQDNEI